MRNTCYTELQSNKNEMTPDARDIQGQATIDLIGRPTVKRDSTDSLAGMSNTDPSFNPQLSALLDLLIQHEETLRNELVKTKQLRQQIENLIPNSPFKDFINSLEEYQE